MGWPRDIAHIRYLIEVGIKHLVTLSAEKRPPNLHAVPQISWTLIHIPEFTAPSVRQINQFIDICEKARENNEPVGVHCWMGRGRTGVMLACYLVKFYGYAPERAIDHVRLCRSGSVETYEQERIVVTYNDYLCSVKK
uniref:Dual specificity protein phosphatase 23 n=1 Tax=Strigamia maritima TaxID=126957 RepID=T1IRS3_STRMM